MDYFVTTYFNYLGSVRRKQLSQEFMARYPYFIMLEVIFPGQESVFEESIKIYKEEVKFYNNELINYFIKNHPDVKTLTFVDSDCILPERFQSKIIREHSNFLRSRPRTSLFIQPYSTTKIKYKSKKYIGMTYNGIVKDYVNGNDLYAGHTGLAYSYNRAFLCKISNFPESLVLGGFDTFLYLSLFKKSDKILELLKIIDSNYVTHDLLNFYKKCDHVAVKYIEQEIITLEHGLKINRLYNERLYMYRDISQQVIDNYFRFRRDDLMLE